MALKKLSFTLTHSGKRLDQALFEHLTPQKISKSKIRKLILEGSVYLNQSRVRIASKPIHAGAKILIYLQETELQPDLTLSLEDIVYEDEDLIAWNKPQGLPTQPTLDSVRNNLLHAATQLLKQRDQRIPVLALHQRLDKDTSGVILLGKSQRVNAPLSQLFLNHHMQKTYYALCSIKATKLSQKPSPQSSWSLLSANQRIWDVQNFLKKKTLPGKKNLQTEVHSGGDLAITHFEILSQNTQKLWIKAQPKTGRMHQIRIHLSLSGCPILGDPLYKGLDFMQGIPIPKVMLHASDLKFDHPIHQKPMHLKASPPKAFELLAQKLGLSNHLV